MRIVIVDDEPLARRRLRQVLAGESGVDVVAECSGADEAREAVGPLAPDALFVDIEMPGEDGLSLAREMEADYPIVIVTAHERYAAEAFDVPAVDYVLKPPEQARCRRAVRRLERVLAARRRTVEAARHIDRLFVKNGDRLVHVRIADVDSFEALGNYVKLRAAGKSHVIRASLSALESRLDPALFVRTHRSHIVNVSRVRELVVISHGDYRIVFDHGTTAPLSRSHRERLGLLTGFLTFNGADGERN
jgi:two-component system LytT family response regulator